MGYEGVVALALARVGPRVVMGLPLGLGKPNPLVNAFYRRAKADARISLEIVTALSLDPPQPGSDLEARFLGPFVARHFGDDYPRLDYIDDLVAGTLPPNVTISEFYLQSGAMLGNAHAQRHYISSNYTHVARDLLDRGVNVALQLVAEGVHDGRRRLSLSCNADVTLDLVDRASRRPDHDLMLIAQVHPALPFMHGDAIVDEDFFDEVVRTEEPAWRPFALPRMPVSTQDYWVGLNASLLIADGGTLQIGIGSLSDALVHALLLRQRDNNGYRALLDEAARTAAPLPERIGGLAPFTTGLYGASEMFMDGFMHLYRAGILRREVFDDERLQQQANAGLLTEEHAGRGAVMDGAFFLGSREFYDFLDMLHDDERPRFRMTSVARINQLYGGNERLEKLQRQRARFVNTCMMMTATGAAVSDALVDHQVVSGVGGQYNFVAMAHAMEDARSILMLRSTRGSGDAVRSNIVWDYPHVTIPRHLRDIVVTEYGIADLRGRSDEECIQALIGIADARFQDVLANEARDRGKLARNWRIPDTARSNRPERLHARLATHAAPEAFPDYPFGSDFTPVEQQLVRALKRLKQWQGSPFEIARAIAKGDPSRWPEAMARLELDAPGEFKTRLLVRALAAALDATSSPPTASQAAGRTN